jgi:cysteinyl-tRNA synthetase
MAKSQGNILKIKDFRDNINGQVLRLALINAHYKQPLDWNDKTARFGAVVIGASQI